MHTALPKPEPSPVRLAWRWFGAALAVRLAAALALRAAQATPLYDEALYLASAQAWTEALPLWLRGLPLPTACAALLYNHGVWPPLHPLLLALPLWAGLPTSACRLVPLLLGAATTPLVWLTARELVPRRGAARAAALHLCCPFWIAFAHYLWSETSFLFFCAAALLTLLWSCRRNRWWAAATGALLGAAALCRVTALALLPLFLLGAAWPPRSGRRTAPAALLLGTFLLVIAPWQYAIWRHERPPAPFLSTGAGYNLLLGNNPRIPAGYGSCWLLPESVLMQRDLMRHVQSTDPSAAPFSSAPTDLFGRDQAARTLARQYLTTTPWRTTIARAWHRLTFSLGPDIFLPRHLLGVAYAPLPFAVIAILVALDWLYGLLLLALCAAAPFSRSVPWRWRLLLTLLAAAALAPALATVGMPRLAHAALLPLLPLAGAAPVTRRTVWPALVAALLFLLPLPTIFAAYLQPSAHYLAPLRRLSPAPLGSDLLAFRNDGAAPQQLLLRCATPATTVAAGGAARTQVVLPLPPRGARTATLTLVCRDVTPPRVALATLDPTSGRPASAATITPLAKPALWRRWQPSGLPGISYRWLGGGAPQRGAPPGGANEDAPP